MLQSISIYYMFFYLAGIVHAHCCTLIVPALGTELFILETTHVKRRDMPAARMKATILFIEGLVYLYNFVPTLVRCLALIRFLHIS